MMKKQNCVIWIQACFIVYRKTDDIYKDIAKDIETRSDASNHELDRPLPNGKNTKVIGLMKNVGKVMTKFIRLKAKTYSYLIDDGSKDKKSKMHKKLCHEKNSSASGKTNSLFDLINYQPDTDKNSSGSGKTNSLFDLINYQPDIDKIYLYAKSPYETKYQLLINKRISTDLKHLNDSKAFIEYFK